MQVSRATEKCFQGDRCDGRYCWYVGSSEKTPARRRYIREAKKTGKLMLKSDGFGGNTRYVHVQETDYKVWLLYFSDK
jgi:hypothetical protein